MPMEANLWNTEKTPQSSLTFRLEDLREARKIIAFQDDRNLVAC